MSTERCLNFASREAAGDGYGYGCKALVESIVACDNIFTIAQVDGESSSTYKAWLRVYDTNMYLYIYNSSGSFYMNSYYGINGTKLAGGSVTSTNFFGRYTGDAYGAYIARIGDFAFAVNGQSASCAMSVCCGLAWCVSEYTGATYWFGTGTSNLAVTYRGLGGCRSPLDELSGSVTGVNINTGVSGGTTFTCSSLTTSCTTPTGATGVLNPWGYSAYTSGEWLGHIKWGGKYDMYRLFSPNGAYGVSSDGSYTIDGTTYKGVFNYMYIPVECG